MLFLIVRLTACSLILSIILSFVDHIGSDDGCPSTQKIVYLGVAADFEYVTQYGSQQNASQQIISNFNTASALYKVCTGIGIL